MLRDGVYMATRKKLTPSAPRRDDVPQWAIQAKITEPRVLEIWENHPLVKVHKCTPEKAQITVKSVPTAKAKLLHEIFKKNSEADFYEKLAIKKFYERDYSGFAKSIIDLMNDEEIEWKEDPYSLAMKLVNYNNRNDAPEAPVFNIVTPWLIKNWCHNEMACLLNARHILDKLDKEGICIAELLKGNPERFIRDTILKLGLKRPKNVGR